MAQSRRSLLMTGLVLFGGYHLVKSGLPALSALVSGGFDFEAMDHPQGFRRLEGGKVSTAFDPFVGLENTGSLRADTALEQNVEARLCEALFDGVAHDPDVLPVASFSDYNCPYCRVLTSRLARLEDEFEGRVRVAWHEYPLLGPSSVFAARAALAAKQQDAYVAFHKRMMGARLVPTPAYLRTVADDIGISHREMLRDMDGEKVNAELARAFALADLFGLVGTPALVVGRTLVQGAITDHELTRLIQREWSDGPVAGCA
jgi:predicted DsbA family dithiol-disulfide isomerase